eukprot:791480_1
MYLLWISIMMMSILNGFEDIDCASLHLEDKQCEIECEYYNNAALYNDFIQLGHDHTKLTDLYNKSMTNFNQTLFDLTLTWYSLSTYPFQYYGSVQPETCQYSFGTYCNVRNSDKQMHGCCLPTHCKNEDARKVLVANIPCYKDYVSFVRGKKTVICHPLQSEWDTGSVVILILFCLLVLFIAISTMIKHRDGQANIGIVMEAFCWQNNLASFIKTRDTEWAFADGIRVIAAFCIVAFHSRSSLWKNSINEPTLWGSKYNNNVYRDNKAFREAWSGHFIYEQFPYVIISNLHSIITFFWLSGFFSLNSMIQILQKWNVNISKRKWKDYFRQILWLYIRRYLRLMVPFLTVFIFNMYILDQLRLPNSYNVTNTRFYRERCSQSFSRTVSMTLSIYKANYFEKHGEYNDGIYGGCLNGGDWFIYAVFIMPMLAFFIGRLSYGIDKNLYEQPYHYGTDLNRAIQLTSYFLPWSWMIHYFGACLFALMLLKYQDKLSNFTLNRFHYWVLQSIALILMFTYIMVPYWYHMTWYYIFGGIVFAIGFTIFMFSLRFSPRNYYSVTKQFLSCKPFRICSKLTYLLYIIHCSLIGPYVNNLEYPSYFSWFNYILLLIPTIIIILLLSFVAWMFITNPIAYLITKFWKRYIEPTVFLNQIHEPLQHEPVHRAPLIEMTTHQQ